MNVSGMISKPKQFKIQGRYGECLFPFLPYPDGATGLNVAIGGWAIVHRRVGNGEVHYYVCRYVKQSRDYHDGYEERCGVTPSFIDTYWPSADKPCKTYAEAKMLWYKIISSHKRAYLL